MPPGVRARRVAKLRPTAEHNQEGSRLDWMVLRPHAWVGLGSACSIPAPSLDVIWDIVLDSATYELMPIIGDKLPLEGARRSVRYVFPGTGNALPTCL